MKNDMAVLNVIAANKWKRPIYFTANFDELGFGPYLRKDGLTYRLVPVTGQQINTDRMSDNLMNKFASGNADKRNVYFDEENRRHLNSIRSAYAELAFDLSNKGRKEDARKVLEKADKMMLQENMPYGMISRGNMHNRNSIAFIEACYRADAKDLAARVIASVRKDLQQQVRFFNALPESKQEWMAYDRKTADDFLQALGSIEQMYGNKASSPENQGTIVNPAPTVPRPDGTRTDTNESK
jgi:hypothetical protein